MATPPPLRLVFIGCVEFSATILDAIASSPDAKIIGVVTRARSAINADFRSLAPQAATLGCPCLQIEGNHQKELAEWMAALTPDVAVCCGWSFLLCPEVLTQPKIGVIGYHPALLPRGRGRHPLIWTLALGLPEAGSSFFLMDQGADSGPLLDQRRLVVSDEDDAATLYNRLQTVANGQIGEILRGLRHGTLTPRPQDPDQGTSWRKRGRADGQIDWRMSSRAIFNLVRALTRPYVGAHCLYKGEDIKIWRATLVAPPLPPFDIEPGRVLDVEGKWITVKTGDGAVILVEHDFPTLPTKGQFL